MKTQDILRTIDHRPWPLPQRPWRWWQSWRRLLFAHWSFEPAAIRALVPEQLELQTYDGRAWVGIVPFELSIRPRYTPLIPWLSRFPEINVRTYVRGGDCEGVFFFSLDAANPIACWAARKTFFLPYYWARMRLRSQDNMHRFESVRRSEKGSGNAEFIGDYGPRGSVYCARPKTLEHWLTERYALFSASPGGRVHKADVHHVQWPLQPATAAIEQNTMLAPAGLSLPDEAPLLHYADRIDVLGWPLEVLA